MTAEICSCQGLDAKCKKCFGSGYVDSATSKKSTVVPKESTSVKKRIAERFLYLPENIESLSKEQVDEIAVKIIESLDLKSKKQMQLLNSIPFNTNTFRRDFKEKFADLEALEREKRNLRNELDQVEKEIVSKKYKSQFKFTHILSDKDIDTTSNRQLKDLIRAYRNSK